MKTKKRTLSLALAALFVGLPLFAGLNASPDEGKTLYKKKFCQSCHAVTPATKARTAKKGTYLGDAGKRLSRSFIVTYLKDPAKARANDAKLDALSKKYAKPMKNPRLSDAEIGKIADYLMTLKD